jgi:hypothetical protein
VRLLSPIVLILFSTVDRIWNQLSMSYAITTQFVGNDLTGFASMAALHH